MTFKSTFTFDQETAEAIKNLALNWKVSQAEAVRRSVQIAVNEIKKDKSRSPLAILELLERKKTSAKDIAAFKNMVKENRKGWDN